MNPTKLELTAEGEQVFSEIKQKISLLATFDGDSLKTEMASLKKAILENPAACSLLLEEDIGMAVAALRRMVGVAVTTATAPKEKKAKTSTKALSAVELAAAMASISEDDF